MKKQCTNSKCRKYFSADISGGQCPYCGRHYSGISAAVPDESSPGQIPSKNKNPRRHQKPLKHMLVTELQFSSITNFLLKRAHIITVRDLVSRSESELLPLLATAKNSFADRLPEIKRKLRSKGLTLRMEENSYRCHSYISVKEKDM